MSQPGRHPQFVIKKWKQQHTTGNLGLPPPIPYTFSRASNEKRTAWNSRSEPEGAPREQALPSQTAHFRGQKGWKSWVSNLVNMADGVTPPILNPDSVSQYDGLIVMLQVHFRGQETARSSSNCYLKLIPKHVAIYSTVNCVCRG